MMRSRLPRMLPVIDALTSSTIPARSATSAMISSAALPNVALSRPPTVGPVRAERCSVASPMKPASGSTARQASVNTSTGDMCCQLANSAAGTASNSSLRQIDPQGEGCFRRCFNGWRGLGGSLGPAPGSRSTTGRRGAGFASGRSRERRSVRCAGCCFRGGSCWAASTFRLRLRSRRSFGGRGSSALAAGAVRPAGRA